MPFIISSSTTTPTYVPPGPVTPFNVFPIRDLWIGRLKLVTYDDSFQEAVGDELILQGGVAALGARKPKRYAMTLPIHGTTADADMYASGQRMRRQVRSMLENTQARSGGFYMNAFLDPEQNGWLMMGSGTIAYAEGGVTLGSYTLTLDEVYRVASSRTYRPARRLDVYDRRLSTTTRDFLGSRYSTDYAFLTGGAYTAASSFVWLPPNTVDVSGLSRQYVTQYPVFSREGAIAAVVGQTHGTVLSYEQIDRKRTAADVVIHDRQGVGNGTAPYVNLVTNPTFEKDVVGAAPAGWLPTIRENNPGAALTVQATGIVGPNAMRVVTTAALVAEGAEISLPGTFLAGQSYTLSIFLAGAQGTETVNFGLGVPGDLQQSSGAVLSTTWARYSTTWTPTANQTNATIFLQHPTASIVTFYVDGVQVTQTPTAVPYFDGSFPGYAWTGVPYASTSQGPYGWVNPVRNPSFLNGTTGWVLSGSGGSLASTVSVVADDPIVSGGSCANITLSGVTSSVFSAGTSLGTDALAVVPGQQVWMEAWVELTAALPVGATLTLSPAVYDASGAYLSNAAAAPTAADSSATPIEASGAKDAWVRLYGTFTIPASGAVATPTIITSGHATNQTLRYQVTHVLLTDATTLGPPPTYNPPGYPNTTFFDGDSPSSTWMGGASNSRSVQWVDPQLTPGWEEVYGAEHVLTPGDVPVLSNGICRVHAEQGAIPAASPYFSFAVDYATPPIAGGGGGWQEMGRWTFYCDTVGNRPFWSSLAGVSVAEWTPERAVIRAAFTNLTGPRRTDVYITLQRGWSGPRFEVYDLPAAGVTPTAYGTTWETMVPANHVAASTRVNGNLAATAAVGIAGDGGGNVGGSSGVAEPFIAIQAYGGYSLPATYLLRERDEPSLYWTSAIPSTFNSYATGTHGQITVSHGITYPYFSEQIAFGLAGAIVEAEAATSGSPTTATVNDPAALTAPAASPSLSTATTGGTLPAGTQKYTINAYNATGETTVPGYANITTTGTTSTVTVTWSAVTGAIGYRVWTERSNGQYGLLASTTATSYTDTGGAIRTTTNYPIVNTSGQVSSGGKFVTDTQAVINNYTLATPTNTLSIDGTYALYARVRLFSGDAITIGWAYAGGINSAVIGATGALGPANTPVTYTATTMAWTWLYVGEITLTQAQVGNVLNINANVTRAAQNPATSNLAIDVLAFIPTQRSASAATNHLFDGARGQAAAQLLDTRPVPEVVQR